MINSFSLLSRSNTEHRFSAHLALSGKMYIMVFSLQWRIDRVYFLAFFTKHTMELDACILLENHKYIVWICTRLDQEAVRGASRITNGDNGSRIKDILGMIFSASSQCFDRYISVTFLSKWSEGIFERLHGNELKNGYIRNFGRSLKGWLRKYPELQVTSRWENCCRLRLCHPYE